MALAAPQRPATVFMPVGEVKPGMIGVSRTVFSGDTLEDFQVQIIGTLDNAIGPGRPLILAKLLGARLAETGVIAGMSGSPVYIDGKLVGAVSYALGSFPKEPIAGITPIQQMLDDVDRPANTSRAASREFALGASATPADVFAALGRVFARAAAPVSAIPAALLGEPALASATLRPIGAAFSVRGFDTSMTGELGRALGNTALRSEAAATDAPQQTTTDPLRPGDAIGASLLHGDFEMGATGTITYINGNRLYAFGHPFLGLGPAQMAMTRARVLTVLPSLQNSMKVANLGPTIGTMSQDRATAVGGDIGAMARELAVSLHLMDTGRGGTPRTFSFRVAHDPAMTPLFAYVAMLNVLTSYQRQTGVITIGINGTASFGTSGTITIDDLFSGDQAFAGAANTVLGPLSAMMNNDFGTAAPDTLDLTLTVSETQSGLTIERAWLDTAHPVFGKTHTLHVLLRNFRGQTETRSLPITMPARGPANVTLLVSDAPTLAALEDKEIDPNWAKTSEDLVVGINRTRRNNRLYVRLLASAPGTLISGRAQPSLPSSTRSVLDADKSIGASALTRTFVGAWEERLDRVVKGSREIALTLSADIR